MAPQLALLLFAVSAALAQPSFQDGDVFAAGTDGKIRRFDSSGRLIQVIEDGLSGPKTGMCFDAQGNLYATSFGALTMSKFDKRGRLIKRGWGGSFNHVESCLIDSSGQLYSGEVGGLRSLIRRFDLQGNPLGRFSAATEDKGIDWIDLAADQCTIFYTSEGSSVKRYDVCQGRQLPDFARGLQAPCFALRIRDNGELMVACENKSYRLSPTGSVMRTYPLRGQTQFAMNLDPDGISFWTGGLNTGNVYKINIESGAGSSSPVFKARAGKGFLKSLLEGNRGLQRLLRGGEGHLAGLAVFGEPTAAAAAPPPEAPSTTLPPVALNAPPPPGVGLSNLDPDPPPALVAPDPGSPPKPPPAAVVSPPPVDIVQQPVQPQPEPEPTPEPEPEPEPEPVQEVLKEPPPPPPKPRASVEFGASSEVAFSQVGSQEESSARLDLSASQVEGLPVVHISTNLDLRGVTLQVETSDGWTDLSRSPVALPLSSVSSLTWPLRLKVGDCPASAPSEPPVMVLESLGKDGQPERLQLPLSIQILPDPWLHCWWPILAAASAALLTGVAAYGFISPSRFASRVGVVLSQEEDMDEGFFYAIRAQPGSRSGFYRDARIYIHPNFRLSKKGAGALARLRASDSQVRIQPQSGASVQRRTLDDQWEALPAGESLARMGTVYRDEMGSIFFELRTG